MKRQFDETPPDLLLHLTVFVGAGEYVHAFAFGTSRVPYVVKMATQLDVPMREGTSTRSARRHELLRMLLPTVGSPPADLLTASLELQWRKRDEGRSEAGSTTSTGAESFTMHGDFRCFIEHVDSNFAMLPSHGMRGVVAIGDWTARFTPQLSDLARHADTSKYGVDVVTDGVLVTGPGTFGAYFSVPLPWERGGMLEAARTAQLTVEFDVAGGRRPVRVASELEHRSNSRSSPLPDTRIVNYFVLKRRSRGLISPS